MTGVQSEFQAGDVQRAIIVSSFDEHARLGLQCGDDTEPLCDSDHALHAIAQPFACLRQVDSWFRNACPEAHGLAAGFSYDLHCELEERHAARAPFGILRDQRWFMLGTRIQQEARAGLHDAAEIQRAQAGSDFGQVGAEIGRERIEMMRVECQRHTVIAAIRDQAERIIEAMIGRAVRIVGEAQAHGLASMAIGVLCTSGSRYRG